MITLSCISLHEEDTLLLRQSLKQQDCNCFLSGNYWIIKLWLKSSHTYICVCGCMCIDIYMYVCVHYSFLLFFFFFFILDNLEDEIWNSGRKNVFNEFYLIRGTECPKTGIFYNFQNFNIFWQGKIFLYIKQYSLN